MNETEFLKQHPGLKDKTFSVYSFKPYEVGVKLKKNWG